MSPSSLVFGFYGEGVRDYGFLFPLVTRSIQELLLPTIDVQGVMLDYINVKGLSQIEKMLHIAEAAHDHEFIIFHLDSDASDPKQAYANRFAPGYQHILKEPERYNRHIVPVIPVRMTEAWMLVDFEAFRKVVATELTANDLGFVSKPHQVESLQKPKEDFEQAVIKARQKRNRIPFDDVYGPLALNIRLANLQSVPAYKLFLARLQDTLVDLHFLDPDRGTT